MSGTIFQPPVDLYVGMRKGTTWGTAVDCDLASARLPILSENIVANITRYNNLSFHGDPIQRKARQGRLGPFSGPLRMPFDIDNCFLPLAQFFGTCSTPVQQGGSSAYTSTLSINNSVKGIFSTIALDKEIDLEEIDSAKIHKIEIEGTADEGVIITFHVIGRYRGWDSSVDWPAVTVALPGSNLTFKKSDPLPFFVFNAAADMKIQLNNATSGALSDSDLIYPSSWRITMERPMKIWVDSSSSPYIAEPVDNGFMMVEGSFTLPLFQATTYMENLQTNTLKKMAILLKSDTIASSYRYEFNLYIPALEITEAPDNATGEETVEHPISWVAKRPDSTPTGMAQAIPYATVQNTHSATPL